VTTPSKYEGYTARMGDDLQSRVYYDTAADGHHLLRVTTRVSQIPSTGEFIVRMLVGATADDRRRSERMVADVGYLQRCWRYWERSGGTFRHWDKTNKRWFFIARTGDVVDVDEAFQSIAENLTLGEVVDAFGREVAQGYLETVGDLGAVAT